MTVISSTKDAENLSLTLVAEFSATPERVWAVWEDPRMLDRWWGPPSWPATFTRHDFVVGGQSRYHLTGPTGEQHHGYWVIHKIERPHRLDFANGLAGADGEPVASLPPMDGYVTFAATDSGTLMTAVSKFIDMEQMEKMLAMGMQEGMALAIAQIDSLIDPVPV